MNEHLCACPFCGEPPKLEQQFVVRCSNYTSCGARPRVTSNDAGTAVFKWNSRVRPEVDWETGEVLNAG